MRVSELRELTREELERRLAEMRSELFKLQLRRSAEQLPNPLRIRTLRRDIARCLTVIKEHNRRSGEQGNA
uniref:Large ribosomal subunit protein uL29 n=1 Tax=candidate division WOR-3 bacterium TaxID=2052148 RepID=A0A7C4GEA7_UNCW3